jgi:hypothetical protein
MQTKILRPRNVWVAMVFSAALISVGEHHDWTFLSKFFEHSLSIALGREVQLEGNDKDFLSQDKKFRVNFFGAFSFFSPHIKIASTGWSRYPDLVKGKDVLVSISYPNIWRAMKGDKFIVDVIHAKQLEVNLERMKDGRSTWNFMKPLAAPSIVWLKVEAGLIRYHDLALSIKSESRFFSSPSDDPTLVSTINFQGLK